MGNLNPVADMLWYDPTTKTIQLYDGDSWQSIAPISRVDLSDADSDYMLQVGEEAIIQFNNSSNVALNIATQNGTAYEILLSDSAQPTYLYPNNTTYANQFTNARLYTYWNGSNYTIGSDGGTTDSGFRFYSGVNRIIVLNDSSNKRVITQFANCVGRYMGISASFWGSSIQWTSLGTFSFAWGFSGFILVRRIK